MRVEVPQQSRLAVDYLLPLLVSMAISLSFAELLLSQGAHAPVTLVPELKDPAASFLNAFLFAGLGLIGISFVYWLARRRNAFLVKLVLIGVLAPWIAVLTVIAGQTILLAALHGNFIGTSRNLILVLLLLASLYASVFASILILIDAMPRRVKNILFLVYGSMIGAFLGLSLPTISLVVILATIAFYDLLMLRREYVSQVLRDLAFDRGTARIFSFSAASVEVGIGEFIVYAVLVAHVFAYFDRILFIISVVLILIGSLINLQQIGRKGVAPGFPIPILLVLIPIVLNVVFVGK